MKICFSNQMRKLDEISTSEFQIPSIVLMENAGKAVTDEIVLAEMANSRDKVLIVCGTGNNGGDGFVAARHLSNRSCQVCVLLCGDESRIKGDALINLNIIKCLPIEIEMINENNMDILDQRLEKCTIIVDAIFGTGFKGALKPFYKSIIDKLNRSDKYIIAVDIPSGLDSDTGFADDGSIKAHKTVTFQLPKLGQVINEGPEACGKLIVSDISIPVKSVEAVKLDMEMLEQPMVARLMKPRMNNSHKGTYGKAFIVAGSRGMTGAAVMAAQAALKSGVGLVLAGVPSGVQELVSGQLREAMTLGLPDDDKSCLTAEAAIEINKISADSILIGPGLSSNPSIYEMLEAVLAAATIPIVIDADGLNAISRKIELLRECKSSVILTPHPGEMARLMNCTISDIQRNRLYYAQKLTQEYGVVTVLKGFRTIITAPEGNLFINPTGNPGMAAAGSGDVLAGLITGFLAQGMKALDAAICGVYLHGAAGDLAAENFGEYGLTASDIINYIPHTIKNVMENYAVNKKA